MAGATLVDTGVLVAFMRESDYWHAEAVRLFHETEGPLVTTAAITSEFFYFMGQFRHSLPKAWDVFDAEIAVIADIRQSDLPALRQLMLRYADRPMDFADATLVHIAERERISDILTVDHNDFEIYQIGRHKKFRTLPKRRND